MSEPIPILDRLLAAAKAWCAANDATLPRLGKRVVRDTSFFNRIEQSNASTTTATLTRFAAFLSDGGNWPDGRVPQIALDFAHVVGVSVEAEALSPGNSGDLSPAPAAERAA